MLLLLLFPGAAALLLHVVMQCTARKYLKFSMIIHWKKGGGRCQPNSNKCSMRWSVLIITLSWQSFKYKNEKNNIFFDSVRRLYNNKSTRLKIWRIKTGGRWGVKSLILRLNSRNNIDMAISSFWGGENNDVELFFCYGLKWLCHEICFLSQILCSPWTFSVLSPRLKVFRKQFKPY